jgi:hypothetical protein
VPPSTFDFSRGTFQMRIMYDLPDASEKPYLVDGPDEATLPFLCLSTLALTLGFLSVFLSLGQLVGM